ncbi:AAA family ATPase [Botrimarina sp.]|uniref:AAA family ATPase n=1 Tax=Botrimarina sp. TaxID=2795802 RepID=UPI0032EDF291
MLALLKETKQKGSEQTVAREATTLQQATAYHDAGFCTIPMRADGAKAPAVDWKRYQSERPSREDLSGWWGADSYGIGIVCGAVSGGLLVLDFDEGSAFEQWRAMAGELCPELLEGLPIVRTPSGGCHVYLRCPTPGRNHKLARRRLADGQIQLLVETRAEGGCVVAPGSPATCHLSGKPYQLLTDVGIESTPVLSEEEAAVLVSIAASLDEVLPDSENRPERSPRAATAEGGCGRPGDRYNATADWNDLLPRHGWRLAYESGGVAYWSRPGKSPRGGISATTGRCVSEECGGLLYVFSTNADPFEAGKTYTKFGAYALLAHRGDHQEAARALGGEGGGALTDPKGERPNLVRMADIEVREVDWLWESRIAAGSVTLLVGQPGVGKSFVTCDLAACVSAGREFADGNPCRQGSVVLVSAEDDPAHTIRPRLEAHGAALEHIHLLSGVTETRTNGSQGELPYTLANVDALTATLETLGDCRLVVIDPIGSYLGSKTDAYRDNEVRAVLSPIVKIAEKFGVAVLIVAHRRKSAAAFADDTAMGSRAFTGVARSVLHLMIDPDDRGRRLLLAGKNNLGRQADGLAFQIEGDPARIVWDEEPVPWTADDVLAREVAGSGRTAPARTRAVDWLRDQLAEGPVKVEDLKAAARHAGHSWRTLERAKRELGVVSSPRDFQGPHEWRLPAEPPARGEAPA